jgi:hypothetical protein
MITGSDTKLATIVAKELAFINRAIQMMARTKKRCIEVMRVRAIDSDIDIEAQYTVNVNDFDSEVDCEIDGNRDIMSGYFGTLCALIDVDMSDVNAMTYLDQPVTDVSLTRQHMSRDIVINRITAAFKNHGACRVVEQLRDMSTRVWTRMAYMAYCNTLLN